MRGFQVHGRRHPAFQGIAPARYAKAPAIAWFKPGKTPLGMWRNQVIAVQHGKIEKIPGHEDAHGVHALVFRPGAAKSVPIKSGEGIAATALQFRSKNVGWHGANLTQPRSL